MQEVSARAVRARAAAPPRGDRRSNYDVVQRHRQTTLGCASLTAVVFFIRVTTERRRGCGGGGGAQFAAMRTARQLEARAAGAAARAAACVAVRRAVACCDRGAHIDRRAQDFVASFGFFFQASCRNIDEALMLNQLTAQQLVLVQIDQMNQRRLDLLLTGQTPSGFHLLTTLQRFDT